MKRFFEITVAIKSAVGLCFTGGMFFLLLVAWGLGMESLPLGHIVSLLLVSIAGGTLQVVAYTDLLIKNMPYTRRILVFLLPFFAVLVVTALAFEWFPMGEMRSWLIFLGIFLTVFVVISVGFEMYFRIAGKRYDGLLGQYRRTKEEQTGKKGE